MPRGPIPTTHLDLLERALLGHLATVDPLGRPQVNPVWFLWDGGHLLVGVLDGAKKLANVRRNPHVALSIADPSNPGRYLEVRGVVARIDLHRDRGFFNRLARKYTGADSEDGEPDDPRHQLTIRIDSWTALG